MEKISNQAAGEKNSPAKAQPSEFWIRIRTGAVLTAAGALVLAFSHIPYVMNAAAAFLSISGTYELLHAVKTDTPPKMLVFSLYSLAVCFLKMPHYSVILAIVWVIAMIAFSIFMKRIGTHRAVSFSCIPPWALVLPLFFRSLAELRLAKHGLYCVTLVILGCLINDVAAYCIGKAFGRQKLAPVISPGKTIEGGLGGLIVSALILTVLSAVFSRCTGAKMRYGLLLLYLILASLIGQFGDLSMSVIKRSAGIKDFSEILPGHGGILDRFDSVLFVAPFAMLLHEITAGFII